MQDSCGNLMGFDVLRMFGSEYGRPFRLILQQKCMLPAGIVAFGTAQSPEISWRVQLGLRVQPALWIFGEANRIVGCGTAVPCYRQRLKTAKTY